MSDIILSMRNGKPVVSSRQIAENFDKNHRDVLRAVDNLKEDVRNFAQMFFESTEADSYGREQRTYELVRAYVNVTVVAPDEPPVRSYMPMKEVLEHPDLHSQMMADAFRDAQSFKQKYNTLERLKPVMDAIDKAFDADQTKHEQIKMAAGMESSIKGAIR